MMFLLKSVIERRSEAVMKNTVVATLLAISSLAISSLAFSASVNAQTVIISALYQNPSSPQTELRYDSADLNRNQMILAVNSSPEVTAIADNLSFANSYDRIFTINRAEKIACMVNGQGSANGAVTCGLIDYE
jgi:hypothetical protein